jgi:hypothetical protein
MPLRLFLLMMFHDQFPRSFLEEERALIKGLISTENHGLQGRLIPFLLEGAVHH